MKREKWNDGMVEWWEIPIAVTLHCPVNRELSEV